MVARRPRAAAAGSIDDARPDRWRERVTRKFERTPRLSLLEYLLCAGGGRYGALGVSLEAEAVRKLLANEPVPELPRRLVRPGASLGGARPKSLLQMVGQPWLVKFNEDDEFDMPLVEHACMTLARACGAARPSPSNASTGRLACACTRSRPTWPCARRASPWATRSSRSC